MIPIFIVIFAAIRLGQAVSPRQKLGLAGALDWFGESGADAEVPDERTIRRRLGPIWKRLQDAE
ncbi:hypothetical protein [Paracoccus aerodenitrificans]|uniref:hypothetical protein n=1 Tax=Paracoccus aerodenitrificans TaxID=3017781 RepID=UPI0022EFE2F0|nr:hypothetical protein [Paracoccus aerodenitrificans]WBU63616.1 hypothetical protein PAE61_14900 [Paracoccus aerodenitrificans]